MMTADTSIADWTSAMSRVHGSLRAEILAGRHMPGTPLRLAALARQFGVSMTVVREALFRLAEQRLVTQAANQGFRVIEASRKDLIDLSDVRLEIECAALRRSVRLGDIAWQGRVMAAHHVLASSSIGSSEWSTAHQAFHDTLCEACDNPRMMSITRSLRDSAEIYRQLYGAHTGESGRDLPGEHRMLMEAALARDADGASLLLREHLEKTRDALLRSVFTDEPRA